MTKQSSFAVKNQNGIGIIESLIAVVIVSLVGYFFMGYIQNASLLGIRVGAMSQCEISLNTILTSIRAQDNSLNIRTWLPKDITNTPAHTLPNDDDPYCNTSPNRTPVCDTLPSMVLTTPTNEVPRTPEAIVTNTIQNWRGAATYLLSVYNATNPPNNPPVCSGVGLTFTGAPSTRTITQLLASLPTTVALNNFSSFTQIGLFIQQVDRSGIPLLCNAVESDAKPQTGIGFEVRLSGTYIDTSMPGTPGTPATKSCSVSGRIYYPTSVPAAPDSALPVPGDLTFRLKNTNNQIIPNDSCTCQDSAATVAANGNVCSYDMYTVKAEILNMPPGLLPVVFLRGPTFGPRAGFRYAPQNATEFKVNGSDILVSTPHVSYNSTTNILVGWDSLALDPPYASPTAQGLNRILAGYVFPDGRIKSTNPIGLKVQLPSCPAQNTYCGNRMDGCGGACPPGNLQYCDPNRGCNVTTNSCGVVGACPPTCSPPLCSGCTDRRLFCGPPAPATDSCEVACDPGIGCPVGGCPDVAGVGCVATNTFCGAPTAPTNDTCGGACPSGDLCPPPVVCAPINTFCGPPDGTPAQPTTNSFGQTCPDGDCSNTSATVCPMRCGDANENSYCQGNEIACDPDPYACAVGSVYVGCMTDPTTGCGVCLMNSPGCACIR